MSKEATASKSITAESIMTTNVLAVLTTATVRDAIVLLTSKRIHGAPIVDNMNVVLSMISEGDLLKLAAAVGLDKPIGQCLDRLPKTAKLISARAHDSFTDIYKMFLSKGIHRIVVTDDNGRLKGIVSRSNVLRVLVDIPVSSEPSAAK